MIDKSRRIAVNHRFETFPYNHLVLYFKAIEKLGFMWLFNIELFLKKAVMGVNQARFELHCLWLDPKMGNKENQFYLKQLQNAGVDIAGFDNNTDFFEALQDLPLADPNQHQPLIAILSGSLSEQTYKAVNNNPKVKHIVLFCGYYPKAVELRTKFRKIGAICLENQVLKRTLGFWEKYDEPNAMLPVSLKKLLDRQASMNVDLAAIRMDLYD